MACVSLRYCQVTASLEGREGRHACSIEVKTWSPDSDLPALIPLWFIIWILHLQMAKPGVCYLTFSSVQSLGLLHFSLSNGPDYNPLARDCTRCILCNSAQGYKHPAGSCYPKLAQVSGCLPVLCSGRALVRLLLPSLLHYG